MRDFLDVVTMHKRFDFPCSEFPSLPELEIFQFRYKFLHEELDEYHLCFGKRNLVGVVDALLDFAYVGCGSALFIGAPRCGPMANWPSFRTACSALVAQGVVDERHAPPHFLTEQLHLYTLHTMRSRVESFNHAYLSALASGSDEGILYLMLVTLKQCVDEAYKAAALMNVPWEKCWHHVAQANLKKRAGVVDKRGVKYDLQKPTGWVSPESSIAAELMMEGWRIPDQMEIDNVSGRVRMINTDYRLRDPANEPGHK